MQISLVSLTTIGFFPPSPAQALLFCVFLFFFLPLLPPPSPPPTFSSASFRCRCSSNVVPSPPRCTYTPGCTQAAFPFLPAAFLFLRPLCVSLFLNSQIYGLPAPDSRERYPRGAVRRPSERSDAFKMTGGIFPKQYRLAAEFRYRLERRNRLRFISVDYAATSQLENAVVSL